MLFALHRVLLLACLLPAGRAAACAQDLPFLADAGPQQAGGRQSAESLEKAQKAENRGDLITVFRHPNTTPWYAAGQANIIFQADTPFHSPYEGTNSFVGRGEYKTSLVGTLFLADQVQRLWNRPATELNQRFNTDFIFDIESAGGRGLSQALGLAGFTNLDVVRNPNLGPVPYVARLEIHQTLGLTGSMVETTRGPLALATSASLRRVELRLGKLTLPDHFDLNEVLSDSHLQFTNWTIDNDGAWDYAADTRGYTYAAYAEYQDRAWAARYALALLPTVANGIDLDYAISRTHAQNIEFELRKSLIPGGHGTQRVLSFINTAHLGDYRQAVNGFLAGATSTPQITAFERFGAVKYGFGYNTEEQITPHLRFGGRFGWNEGQHESYAYTEVDQSITLGGDYNGSQWGRPNDKLGIAVVSNAIKKDHQNYLRLGGLGFLLGDGRLNYGRETTEEAYYNLHTWRGMYFALGFSHIADPGYNRDRGPVWVPSVRSHIDF